jgi:hypothetical protein
VSPKKRSGTRSAASSTSSPPEPLTLYLDESLDGESLATALEQAGARIIRGSKHFPRGTPDETWLNECGRNGWIVLTRDKRIRYRVLERTALHEAGVKALVFTVQILVGALASIGRIARAEPPPFIYHVGASGKPKRMD